MNLKIRTLTVTAATFALLGAASLPMLGVGTASANDDELKPATVILHGPIGFATATPTPKVRIIKPLLPTATPTMGIQWVTVTPTPTPKLEIAVPPTRTPTPEKPKIIKPPTATPTPALEIAPPPTEVPTEEPTEEPTATPTTEPAPQQPQGGDTSGGSGTGNVGEQPDSGTDGAGSEEPVDEPTDAETSDQFALEPENRTSREVVSALESVPGVGLVFPVAREVIGADDLSMLGGALAVFGAGLGLVAYKRERRTEDE